MREKQESDYAVQSREKITSIHNSIGKEKKGDVFYVVFLIQLGKRKRKTAFTCLYRKKKREKRGYAYFFIYGLRTLRLLRPIEEGERKTQVEGIPLAAGGGERKVGGVFPSHLRVPGEGKEGKGKKGFSVL